MFLIVFNGGVTSRVQSSEQDADIDSVLILLVFFCQVQISFSHEHPGAGGEAGLPARLMTISWLLLFIRQTDGRTQTPFFFFYSADNELSDCPQCFGLMDETMWVSADASQMNWESLKKNGQLAIHRSFGCFFPSWWLKGRRRRHKCKAETFTVE